MQQVRPYGSWPSPIDSAALVAGARLLSAPRFVGDRLYWIERRPAEAGRQVVMEQACPAPGGAGGRGLGLAPREVSPPAVSARTRVHEYGGGEYAIDRGRLFLVDDVTRRLVGGPLGGPLAPIAPAGSCYADLVVSPDGRWLVAVEERPREGREPENRLVAIALDPDAGSASGLVLGPPRVVAAGHDFYSSAVFDREGARLAFLAWDHPHMPWNETRLECLAWSSAGPSGDVRGVAGRRGESLFAPGFGPDGVLYVVSDRSGFWNLTRVGERDLVPVHAIAGELGRPQWVFGLSTWAFLADGRIVASLSLAGRDALCLIAPQSGAMRVLSSAFVSIAAIAAGAGSFACIAGTSTRGLGLHFGTVPEGPLEIVRDAGLPGGVEADPSRGESLELVLPDGRRTHGHFFAPHSKAWAGPARERPPLLVKTHGGPTSATSAALDPRIQFWTSRGFAVVDVDYTGSSGYGRAYRDALAGAWGVADVEDCVAVAQALARAGRVDPARLAISGGSAGGFTTLCALTFHDLFRAGASHYGIGDLEALARDTHKFESRYTDWLVGPWPAARARYVERSPIHHVDRLACPVIFFQGLEDRVVPPNQAEAMVEALARRGIPHAYVPFAGEGHGFRRAENVRTALDGELYFYGRVFGFYAPRPAAVEIRTRGGRAGDAR